MKKALSLVSSAALALALTVPVPAQMAKKLSGAPGGRAVEQMAKSAKAMPRSVQMLKARTAPAGGATPSLSKAMNAAGAIARKAPVKKLAAGANLPDLRGSVIFNDAGAGNNPGLYSIKDGQTELIFAGPAASYGGVLVDDVYYTSEYKDLFGIIQYVEISAYDIETGEKIATLDGDVDNLTMGMTLDPTTGTVYGITYNSAGDGIQLAKIDLSTSAMTTTAIAPMSGSWNTLACDAQGQLYGISYVGTGSGDSFTVTSSTLCKIDKTTADVTIVGETGQLPQYLSSGAIDPKTGRMFWNVCPPDDSGLLCEVNLATGAATVLCTLADNDEIMGMYVNAPAAEDGAPASVTALEASFPEGALSGTVNFSAPTTLFNGTAATGALTYEVLANGAPAASGSTSFGATVNAPVTMAAAGEVTFTVTVSNAAGKSPKAKTTVFVGKGTPAAAKPQLTYADGKMNLAWAPVTTSADGGYINPAAVTYTVTRYPGAAEVAKDITATSFSEAIAQPTEITAYYYTVVAKCAGIASAEGKSNSITLGSIEPPYANSFDTTDALDGFTIIDGNEDGKIWKVSGGKAQMTYNVSKDMDDWLITPPLHLEAGKAYYVSFTAQNNGASYPERLEVKYGLQPTAAGMTETLVPATDITGAKVVHELGDFLVPATTGNYYIGFHGISDADKYYLNIDDLKVGAATSMGAPGEATDIVITPDANGALKANVAFKAPAKNLGGEALSAITKVEVSRGGAVVKTFTSPAVGAALSFDDTMDAGGNVTYTIQATNAEGPGREVSATAFVGVDAPAAPTDVTIVETANVGEVKVSWAAVTTDKNGNAINPALVTYAVCSNVNNAWVPFVENLTVTSHTFQAVEAGQQDFVQYAVFAVTSGGETGAGTDMIAVGTPYDGIEESFPDGSLNYIWGTNSAGGGQWQIMTDTSLDGIASMDGDNGYAGMSANYLDRSADLFSGKVSLQGMTTPGVSYYTYNIHNENGENVDINEISLLVREAGAADWTVAETTVINTLSDMGGWQQVTVSLAAYAGKTVQIGLRPVVKAFAYTLVDNIKVGNLLGNDLAARDIAAPEKVVAGKDYTVGVTVGNSGMLDAASFTVELYADNELAETKTVNALAAGASTTVEFARTMGAVAETPVDYYAKVVYAADENTENNTTKTISVAPRYSNLPKVTDLAGTSTADGVKLTWSEPDLTSVGMETVVDFEDATSFAQEYAGWTFIDADKKAVGGFQNPSTQATIPIPGITVGESNVAFFVFDDTDPNFANDSYKAHSGHKYLASLFLYDGSNCDDWAISPELDGTAQTISFYAKSYSSQYAETIQMCYSTTGKEVADFQAVAEKKSIPSAWTLYSFDVPAGAKYFAIRSYDTNAFMLMLDDFTFSAAGSSADLSIVGYDVYRDGVKITAEPTGETEYVDTEATDGPHTYVVVTVYTTGTSAPSNSETVAFSGIDDVLAGGISITAARGTITVAGADGKHVAIAAADGKLIHSGVAAGKLTVSVAPGVYVVKADNTIAKVAVK